MAANAAAAEEEEEEEAARPLFLWALLLVAVDLVEEDRVLWILEKASNTSLGAYPNKSCLLLFFFNMGVPFLVAEEKYQVGLLSSSNDHGVGGITTERVNNNNNKMLIHWMTKKELKKIEPQKKSVLKSIPKVSGMANREHSPGSVVFLEMVSDSKTARCV